MARPLYSASVPDPLALNDRGHAGLWYDKFCNTWNLSNGIWSMTAGGGGRNPKLEWIKSVADRRIGHPEQLNEYAVRTVQLVEARGGRWAALTTESRFVTGLGRGHPVENGFAWHPTLGAPFLPGSSVKGMTRAWAEAEAMTDDQVKRLFGEQDHGGGIMFLDAIPTEPVQLEPDVMTPHYAGWSPDEPPGDWLSPTPIPFLTTATQSVFLFGILPKTGVDNSELDAVWGFVMEALAWAGAGAKTAVGYGRLAETGGTARMQQRLTAQVARRLELERQQQADRERAEQLDRLSPVERQIQEALASRNNPDEPDTTTIYRMIDQDMSSGPEQVEAAHWLADRMREEGKWKEITNARRPERDREHQRTLQVMAWLKEE